MVPGANGAVRSQADQLNWLRSANGELKTRRRAVQGPKSTAESVTYRALVPSIQDGAARLWR